MTRHGGAEWLPRREPAPIAEYGLLADCHSAGLVACDGAIDWLCMPRLDSPAVFCQLLDPTGGGYAGVAPTAPWRSHRRYLGRSMALETTFETDDGVVTVTDALTMHEGGRQHPHRQLVRIVTGVRGCVEVALYLAPRLEYGSVSPWLRSVDDTTVTAVGGASGLVLSGDVPLRLSGHHDVVATVTLGAGDRRRLSLVWVPAHELDGQVPGVMSARGIDDRLAETLEWWEDWATDLRPEVADAAGIQRSAVVIKALIHAPTGAMAAAPTTSLPERVGGIRNWDYRYSWIRDSIFATRSLVRVGLDAEADGFRRFVERSCAGNAAELRVMYGLGGETLLAEHELAHLPGYRGSQPVRVGNDAYGQLQLDAFGYVADLSWAWVQLGHEPDDDYWRFVCDIADHVCEVWQQPDRGFWEVRGEPQHFTHSKVMCWAALDRTIALAERSDRPRGECDWWGTRDLVAADIARHGYDAGRGVFVRAYDDPGLDASLMLLPTVDFLRWDDERMVRTVDAVRTELEVAPGLLVRYRSPDGLAGDEGAFLACSFWLAEALANQRRNDEADQVLLAAEATANDLGLFAEEVDIADGSLLGNFPQALTHLAHINARCARHGIDGLRGGGHPSASRQP